MRIGPLDQGPFVNDEAFRTIREANAAGGGRELTLEADARCQSREQQPTWCKQPPELVEHGSEITFIAGEVQHGAADDRVDGGIGPRERIKRPAVRVVGGNRHVQGRGEPANPVDRHRVGVGDTDVEPVLEEERQVPSATAAGIEHAPPAVESAAQQLVEEIDVDLSERRSEVGRHAVTHRRMLSPRRAQMPLALAPPSCDEFRMAVDPDFEARTRQAAQAGDAQAMFTLGGILFQKQERAEAEAWWRKAAEQGNVDAMSNLAAILLETDPDNAVSWLTRAAEHGHDLAMHNLGYIAYQRGAIDEALAWYLKAAQRGYTSSMYNYATLVLKTDFDEADRWLTRAARLGDVGAMRKLATMLAERDPARAEGWARKAAESESQ